MIQYQSVLDTAEKKDEQLIYIDSHDGFLASFGYQLFYSRRGNPRVDLFNYTNPVLHTANVPQTHLAHATMLMHTHLVGIWHDAHS